jgi:hypothetical protein
MQMPPATSPEELTEELEALLEELKEQQSTDDDEQIWQAFCHFMAKLGKGSNRLDCSIFKIDHGQESVAAVAEFFNIGSFHCTPNKSEIEISDVETQAGLTPRSYKLSGSFSSSNYEDEEFHDFELAFEDVSPPKGVPILGPYRRGRFYSLRGQDAACDPGLLGSRTCFQWPAMLGLQSQDDASDSDNTLDIMAMAML